MKKTPNAKKYGFTLLEVVVVVIVLAILASIAVPRYTRALERSRAAEGTYFLGTLLSSMERYNLEQGQFPSNQIFSSTTGLDIDVPTLKYFTSGTRVWASCSSAFPCATVYRNASPTYTLAIRRDGTVYCVPAGSQECSDAGY